MSLNHLADVAAAMETGAPDKAKAKRARAECETAELSASSQASDALPSLKKVAVASSGLVVPQPPSDAITAAVLAPQPPPQLTPQPPLPPVEPVWDRCTVDGCHKKVGKGGTTQRCPAHGGGARAEKYLGDRCEVPECSKKMALHSVIKRCRLHGMSCCLDAQIAPKNKISFLTFSFGAKDYHVLRRMKSINDDNLLDYFSPYQSR